MDYEVRVSVEMTVDFKIEADSDCQVRTAVKNYLPYIENGKLEKQPISIKVDDNDEVTNIFVLEARVEDLNELD